LCSFIKTAAGKLDSLHPSGWGQWQWVRLSSQSLSASRSFPYFFTRASDTEQKLRTGGRPSRHGTDTWPV